MVHGQYPVRRSALDLYDFTAGAAERRALMASGRLPWWTDPSFQLAFLRPLSSALLFFDYAVLGSAVPERHHWHSALWWTASLLAVAGLLGRVLPRSVALIAVALYAVDDAHTLPVTWNANRTALVAVALMVSALWAHVAWTARRRPGLRVVALLLMTGGVFTGEYSLGLFAYFVAHALSEDRAGLWPRARALLPFAVPLAAYLVTRSWLGYGASGSSFYVDPVREPAQYIVASATRVPLLLGDLVFGYTAEWWYGMPPWALRCLQRGVLPAAWFSPDRLRALQMTLGIGALVLVLWASVRFGRPLAKPCSRSAQWLLLGSLLSLFPLCGVFPMSRLTLGPALGADAVLAWVVVYAWRRMTQPCSLLMRGGALAVIALVAFVHGVSAVQRGRDAVRAWAATSRLEEDWVRYAAIDDRGLASRHVVVVSAQDLATQYALPYVRHLHGLTAPASSEILLPPCSGPLELARVASNVLEIRISNPYDQSAFRRNVYWPAAERGFRRGQRFVTERFTVVVIETDHGDVRQLRFAFDRTLDDPTYLFLYPVQSGLRPLRLPSVGHTLRLAAPSPVSAQRAD
jgi:hypothetical protein